MADDEYLLNRVKIQTDNPEISKLEIRRNLRQKPNMRVLGSIRTRLGIYNLSGRDEGKGINRWLKRIGEPPVIYRNMLTGHSVVRIENYLRNKGYYDAKVSSRLITNKKKATVIYTINTGKRTVVDELVFRDKYNYTSGSLVDTVGVLKELLAGTDETLITKGSPLDLDLLDSERTRITKNLRSKGYYNFSKNDVQYYADTTYSISNDKARVLLSINTNPTDTNAYKQYKIKNIEITFDYDPVVFMKNGVTDYKQELFKGYLLKYQDNLKVDPNLIIETLQFGVGEIYNASKVMNSYTRLQALDLFKFVNIVFRDAKDNSSNVGELICEVQLTFQKRQSYNIFLEGTHNTGNIGVGGNFSYGHRNLFKGGENFTLSFFGALKKEQYGGGLFSTHEIGVEAKLVSPQFWMPFFKMKDFRRESAPRSSISFSYSDEITTFYDRQIASGKLGYFWRKYDKKWNYNVDVIDLNYVRMRNVKSEFVDSLKNEYIKSAYTSHLIFSANFSAVYNDMLTSKLGSYNYFRLGLESSGNLLSVLAPFVGKKSDSESGSHYDVFGSQFAQYVKGDFEYKYYFYINQANAVVYRLFIGCGYPYGNMKALPFEKAYYVGGSNGIRAWHSRTLGPGTYVADDNYPNNVGDFKLETNLEYRYNLFWLLEGALFLDVGNVWNITKYENRKGAKLNHNFYKDLAVGTGLGLRLDANIFVLRFDWGIKMRDPAKEKHFVLFDNGKWLKNTVFNIAIGYPF
ncbi:MAG: BamA/TamA family outer membrane protein [Culturomica sp.]|nr:BamA/TamA family outer membrane protein [Culturomica sp.]